VFLREREKKKKKRKKKKGEASSFETRLYKIELVLASLWQWKFLGFPTCFTYYLPCIWEM